MYIIGAVARQDSAKVALFDKEYKLLAQKEGASAALADLCLGMVAENGIKSCDVAYIGVAADNVQATADLEKQIGIKCFDASYMGARAFGEAYLSGDVPYLFLLNVDDTVECGIVIERKIFSGMHQLGGRIAHMVINSDGYACDCGRNGCFEAYASNAGLKKIALEAGLTDVESLTHAKLFAMESAEAACAKTNYVAYLASGITNVINLFQPNVLVLEGPFTEVGEALMEPMMDIILREQYTHSMSNKCKIRSSNDADTTALIGAALLGR